MQPLRVLFPSLGLEISLQVLTYNTTSTIQLLPTQSSRED